MTRRHLVLWNPRYAVVLLAVLLLASPAAAQDGRPGPEPPNPPADAAAETDQPESANPDNAPAPPKHNNGRRPPKDDKVKLFFKDASVGKDEIIAFIVETTGKVVMPVNINILKAKKITLINDEPMDRMEALDLLFQAFRVNGVGVIEQEDRIIIALLSEMPQHDTPVIGADEDIMDRTDRGTVITKIFRIENTDAADISDQLQGTLPSHATLGVDENSNSIILLGDIGLCQRMGKLISELDHRYLRVKTETFRLAHADAAEIAQNILDLFEEARTTSPASRAQQQARQRRQPAQRGTARQVQQRTTGTGDGTIGPTAELRITVNVQQNSVTVSGEPAVVDEIAELIDNQWDLPRPKGTAKVYYLRYTDPIKMRDMLQDLLSGQSGGGARQTPRGRAGAAAARSNVQQAIGGIYTFQAYPDSHTLVVLCKTVESFDFLDSIIEQLDQPLNAGLPIVVELKHANAVELSEQLNVMFAEAGAGGTIRAPASGLSGGEGVGDSPFAGGGAGAGTGGGRDDASGQTISFPWQRGRARDDQTPESPLIGSVRIVPIARQNALLVLAVPEFQQSVLDVIATLDKPGRQVMISCIIAEVELTDELALGLRVSNSNTILGGGLPDNRIGATLSAEATENDIFGNLFDMSILNVGVSVNLVIQALAQKTNVRVLQEPRIFTADNQEATFFDGQDIPFITNTQTTDFGSVNESFEYKAVGIMLNVRPQITVEKDVDLEINLELSSIVPGQVLFGGFIVDRRETTTQIIVKNGQTIVLSGILRDTESQIVRKIPILGDIPLLGELFTSRETAKTKTELLVFITPVVVDNPSENDTNFNAGERQRLEELTRPLKEQARSREREPVGTHLLHKQFARTQQTSPQAADIDADEPSEE
ncbi:MAG: hypothetical protein O6933_09620 [Planctomycetota bacterium]|nr:hypothetical protein [Planctomycetota bacterium]